MLHFINHRLRERPSAGYAEKKVWHLLDGVRAAVSEQQNSRFLWIGLQVQERVPHLYIYCNR
jgi:hypothetical protein